MPPDPVQTFVQYKPNRSVILTDGKRRSRIRVPAAGVSSGSHNFFARVVLLPFVQPVLLIQAKPPASAQSLINAWACSIPYQLLTSWAFQRVFMGYSSEGCSGQCQPWRKVNGCWRTDLVAVWLVRGFVLFLPCGLVWSLVLAGFVRSDELPACAALACALQYCHAIAGILGRGSMQGI